MQYDDEIPIKGPWGYHPVPYKKELAKRLYKEWGDRIEGLSREDAEKLPVEVIAHAVESAQKWRLSFWYSATATVAGAILAPTLFLATDFKLATAAWVAVPVVSAVKLVVLIKANGAYQKNLASHPSLNRE